MVSSKKLFWAGCLVIAVLSFVWLRAEIRLQTLREKLGSLQVEWAALEKRKAAAQRESDEKAKESASLTKESLSSAQDVRREATLVVIAQLKVAHDLSPQPPRKRSPPPPSGPKGILFPELLSDPDYSSAYLFILRARMRSSKMPGLLRLGLSRELANKAIDVLAEQQLAIEDYHQLSGTNGGIPGNFYQPIADDTNQRLRQIMGNEIYARYESLTVAKSVIVPNADGHSWHGYSVPSREALVAEVLNSLAPALATRLSYSTTPLAKEQSEQLAELLAENCTGLGDQPYKVIFTDAFIEKTSSVLSAPQIESLRELQVENLAIEKRAKLPKNSELPRSITSK